MRNARGIAVVVAVALAIALQGTAAAAPAKPSDFNGDGHSDLAVAAPSATAGGHFAAGALATVTGSATGLDPKKTTAIDKSSDLVPGNPNPYQDFGQSIESGDFNGDGFADLSVYSEEKHTHNLDGSLFVLFGSPNGFATSVEIEAPRDYSGGSFGLRQAVGDFNKDGYADIYGSMRSDDSIGYVIYGSSDLAEPGAVKPVRIPTDNWRFYFIPQDPAAGDIDGDGYDDLILPRIQNTRSEVLLFRGGPNGLPATRSQRLAGGGVHTAVGDLDNDGYDDVAFGDPTVQVSGQFHAGQVKIWYGSKTGLDAARGMTKLTEASTRIPGELGKYDEFGVDVAIGDVNGNGRAELAIGVPGEDYRAVSGAGKVIVVYGDAKGIVTSTARIETFTQASSGVQGDPDAEDSFGERMAFRDFNGDHRNELLVSASEGLKGSVTVLKATAGGLTGSGSQTYTPKNTGIDPDPRARFGTLDK